jgi:hypothetical protein
MLASDSSLKDAADLPYRVTEVSLGRLAVRCLREQGTVPAGSLGVAATREISKSGRFTIRSSRSSGAWHQASVGPVDHRQSPNAPANADSLSSAVDALSLQRW